MNWQSKFGCTVWPPNFKFCTLSRWDRNSQTDKWTDWPCDSSIPPSNFIAGGYNNCNTWLSYMAFLRSADYVGRPFCFCSVSYYFYSFLFFSTADFLQRFLRYFSTDLDQIWQVDSPWWDEEPEYFFKSIRLGVGTGRGPKVLLCFIIGKTLYTVRRDKNFT